MRAATFAIGCPTAQRASNSSSQGHSALVRFPILRAFAGISHMKAAQHVLRGADAISAVCTRINFKLLRQGLEDSANLHYLGD